MQKRDICKLFGKYLSGRKTEIDWDALKKLSPADWAGLISLSNGLGITLLIYQAIKDSDCSRGLVPPAVLERFKEIYLHNMRRNARLLYDACCAIKSLTDNGIAVIALKGLSLVGDVYEDIALRPMTDIDLLIRKEDLVEAGKLLLRLDYRQGVPSWEAMAGISHHLPSFYRQGRAGIELHWNLVQPSSPVKVDIDGLWERAGSAKIDGVDVRVLSLEDSLLHLCVHVSSHERFRVGFIPFCDIARLIHAHAAECDWKAVAARAHQWGAERCVYLTLLIAEEFLGAGVPDNVMEGLRPRDFEAVFLEEAEEELFGPDSYDHVAGTRACNLANSLKIKRPGGGVSLLLEGAFPPKEFIARRYPVPTSSPRVYLYYFPHLFKLIFDYSRLLSRLIRRDEAIIDAYHKERKLERLCDWMSGGS